jgi:hypothetical protein
MIEALSRNHCCWGKEISITYSECVSLVLVIQPSEPLICILFLSMACREAPYFSTSFHKRLDYQGRGILNIKCVFWFSPQIYYDSFLIPRKFKDLRVLSWMYVGLHVEYRYYCQISIIFKLSRLNILRKSAQWNSSCPTRTDRHICRPKGRHDESISRLQFYEHQRKCRHMQLHRNVIAYCLKQHEFRIKLQAIPLLSAD